MAKTTKPAAPAAPARPAATTTGKPATPRTAPAARTPRIQHAPLFGKENYRLMLVGIILIALGLILMAGGKSKDPNVFNPKEIYSFTRITLAPILILGGFVIEIFAIFRNGKKSSQ
jgi:hypothetical protein